MFLGEGKKEKKRKKIYSPLSFYLLPVSVLGNGKGGGKASITNNIQRSFYFQGYLEKIEPLQIVAFSYVWATVHAYSYRGIVKKRAPRYW